MDVTTAIERRRAVRKFDPAHRMGDDAVQRLLSLAQLAPSAFNIQHWRFVVVRDAALRAEIRAACWMQPQITEAALLVVVCADLAAWRKAPERYLSGIAPEVREGLLRDRASGSITMKWSRSTVSDRSRQWRTPSTTPPRPKSGPRCGP